MQPSYKLGCMMGDGIGPEIVPAARMVIDRALTVVGALPFDWIELPMGALALQETGSPMPLENKKVLAGCHGWLIGPHDSASYPETWHDRRERPPGGELRHFFDLFLNVRPSRSRSGIPSRSTSLDIVVVRENMEGFYADRNMHFGSGEFMPTEDVALAVGVFTRSAIRRVAEFAFDLARTRRNHVTLVHKANVLPTTFRLWIEECRAVAQSYPNVRFDDVLFDAMTALLVRTPQRFDVVLAENMFGDVLSDLAGELAGGLGLSGSLNVGERYAMAQAAHGSAPDIAGRNVANPVGMISSSAMLLEWLGTRHSDKPLVEASKRVEGALDRILERGHGTRDLGGAMGTQEFANSVCEELSVEEA